jgi:hypothetical protein
MLTARPPLACLIVAALATAGCGSGSQDSGSSESSDSSMACLTQSVEAPKLYASATDEGVEKGVRPLLTPGFKGGEILTGQLGAVVIEYPSTADAQKAFERASKPGALGLDVDAPKLLRKTLLIDYTHDRNIRRIVTACALHPDEPPPPPT